MMKRTGLVLLVLALSVSSAAAQQKYALVTGNAAYTGITRLNNPVNDARDISAALRGLGFTVDQMTNASRVQMEEAVMRLKNRLSAAPGSYGFFYYAGHGVQSGGENYLIPVDASIPSEAYLRDRAVPMSAVLDELNSAGNTLNIVVLDACRDNPFSWRRSGTRGLQVVSNQPADSIIVYATGAGSTAADGTGRNGLFTTHLLNNLKKPGLSVQDVFNQTGADVRRASGGAQIPAIYSQFFDVAYLGTKPAVVQPAPAPVQPAAAPQVTRLDTGFQLDLSGRWNDSDVRQVCATLINDCLNSPRVNQLIQQYSTRNNGALPTCLVGSFRNTSDEHIDMSIISKAMEIAIVNSGKLKFVATAGNEIEANFILTGSVQTIVEKAGNTFVRSYFVNAELTNIDTSTRLWMGTNNEIKKVIRQARTRL
jgi:hypothetical protein